MRKKMLWFAGTSVLVAVGAWGYQERNTPPKPAEKGPTLEVTMKFIQDKMNDIGQVNWVEYYHDKTKGSDWTNQYGSEIKNLVAAPSDCRITYHEFAGNSQLGLTEFEYTLQLKDIADIVMVPQLEDQRRTFAAATNAQYHDWMVTNVAPPVFLLRLSTNHPVEARISKTQQPLSSSKKIDFKFLDEKLADRVAKALQHAAELCGAGENREPF
jgi:hypothetical protein